MRWTTGEVVVEVSGWPEQSEDARLSVEVSVHPETAKDFEAIVAACGGLSVFNISDTSAYMVVALTPEGGVQPPVTGTMIFGPHITVWVPDEVAKGKAVYLPGMKELRARRDAERAGAESAG